MNTRATIALLIAFVMLTAGYFGLAWWQSGRAREEAAAKRLFAYEADDLASIRIERTDGTFVEARQRDGRWDVTAPYDHIEPNATVWRRLSTAWATLTNERTLGDRELTDYALDQPVLTVVASTADGDATTVRFGATEPLQVARYAYTEDLGVFLVREDAFREIDRPLEDLRERHLAQVGEEGITELEFAYLREAEQDGQPPDTGLKPVEQSVAMLARKDGGTWQLIEPLEVAANQEALEALARGLQFAVGTGYIDAPESYEDYGLDPPRAQVALSGESMPEPEVIFFGSADAATAGGAIWAKKKGNPSVFRLSGHLLGLLPEEPDSFRERRLLTRDIEGIEALNIRYKGGSIRLVNDPERGWQMLGPVAADTDQTAVSAYLAMLKHVEGDTFPEITEAEAGLTAPEYHVTFHYPDETREIKIGGPMSEDPAAAHYAQQDIGDITIISDVMRNAIVRGPFDFRDKRLLAFDPKNTTAMHLTLDGQSYVLERPSGRPWQVTSPPGAVLESQSDAAALMQALQEARAASIEVGEEQTSTADIDQYGLAEPVFTAELTVVDEAGAARTIGPLRIGAVVPDDAQQRFAQSDPRPDVLRVKQAVLDSVREALRGIR